MHKRSESELFPIINISRIDNDKNKSKLEVKKIKLDNLDHKIKHMNISSSTKNFNNNNSTFFNGTQVSIFSSMNISNTSQFHSGMKTSKHHYEEPATFEDYGKEIKNLFTSYRNDSLPSDQRTGKFEMVSFKEKTKIAEDLKKRTKFKGENNESAIKATIDIENYYHPLDSLNIIKRNNIILRSITKTYDDRNKQLLSQKLKEVNKEMEYREKIPKKIKITNIIQKTSVDPLSPPQEVRYTGIIPMLPTNGGNPFVEFFSSYYYGNKTFPEGREQFTINSDVSDILLYGGLVSNKSQCIWSLDPSKYSNI